MYDESKLIRPSEFTSLVDLEEYIKVLVNKIRVGIIKDEDVKAATKHIIKCQEYLTKIGNKSRSYIHTNSTKEEKNMNNIYEFKVTLRGEGSNPDEAWNNATDEFALDPGPTPDEENYEIIEEEEEDLEDGD